MIHSLKIVHLRWICLWQKNWYLSARGGSLPTGQADALGGKIIVSLFITGLFFSASHVYAQDITSGLVGHWKFDETLGTTASDSSGNNNTGTLTNGPTWTTGKIGGGLQFDGVDDKVSIIDPNIVEGLAGMTVSAWVKSNLGLKAANEMFVAQNGGGADVFALGWNATEDVYFSVQDTGAVNQVATFADGILNTSWHHVVGVMDSGSIRVYVDTVVGGITDTITTNSNSSTNALTMGDDASGGDAFNGLIDDVRIYNRALTSSDIQALYNLGSGPLDTTFPTVSISSPASGSTVSGTITVSANASDNVGVSGVQFLLDGVNLGAEDTTSPYSLAWDTTSATNASHTLTARARDAAGNTTTSSGVTVTVSNVVLSPDVTSPTIPPNLSATAQSSSQINLSWTASTDPIIAGQITSGVTGYRVERCQGATCTNFMQVGTPTGTTYNDTTGLTANTIYRYQVRAVDAALNLSGYSGIASATTQAAPSFDFSLSNGGNRSVTQGQSTINTITATLVSGTTQSVSFSASGLPAGTFASFSPINCTPTCSSTLTIATQSSTPTGSYTVTVTAINGTISRITSFMLTVTQPSSSSWTPPIGIPMPPAAGTGNENLITIEAPSYDLTNSPHYYVDNSVPCNNTNNGGRGAPTAPRCTVPTSLTAGSLVEVRGGPYSGGAVTWSFSGTINAPVFIRGVGAAKPQFVNQTVNLTGTYGIVENLDLSWPGGSGRVDFINSSSNHLTLRNSFIHNSNSNHIVRNSGPDDTVIYNNEISYAGTPGTERAGVGIAPNSERIWVVDNHIHHNATDALLFCHVCTTNAPSHVYIGRNEMHDNGENAVDIKYTSGPVIISQNNIHTQFGVSGGGPAIRINDEGTQGPVWILFNKIHDSINGINPNGSDADSYMIGNLFHTITGYAIASIGTKGTAQVGNNTIYNTGSGIGAVTSDFNNLKLTTGNAGQYVVNAVSGDFHLLQNSPAVDTGIPMPQTILNAFQTDIGMPFPLVDFDRISRPQGTAWDMGAYEYVSGGTPPPSTLIGDLNLDRTVNGADWSLMSAMWFTSDATADLNSDGIVNSIDFSLMNKNWGRSI